MRVLIIDDSRTMRRIIRKALEGMPGIVSEILEAEDGVEALGLLRNEHLEIDLILLDWNMPRLDGIGFLKSLKSLSPFREVSVIMITSQAQRQQVAEALRWGVKDFIVKPFVDAVLKEKLEKIHSRIEVQKSEDTSVMIRTLVATAQPRVDTPFMERLPDTLIGEFFVRGRLSFHAAGDIILERGRPAESFQICAKGELESIPVRSEDAARVIPEGDCIALPSFVFGHALTESVRAKSAAQILSLSRSQISDLIRDYPKLGVLIGSSVARSTVQPVPNAPDGASKPDLSGKLQAVSLSEIIQILHICHKTGHLRLDRRDGKGGLYFDDGRIVHAWAGSILGEDAFYRIMSWSDADFAFDSGARTAQSSILQPTMSLLLEGARQADEAHRTREGA